MKIVLTLILLHKLGFWGKCRSLLNGIFYFECHVVAVLLIRFFPVNKIRALIMKAKIITTLPIFVFPETAINFPIRATEPPAITANATWPCINLKPHSPNNIGAINAAEYMVKAKSNIPMIDE